MKNKIIIPSVLFVVVAVFSIIVIFQNDKRIKQPMTESSNGKVGENKDIVLFYGDGCPHCAVVEEYVNQNDIETKVKFVTKEVYNNKQNSNDLVTKAKTCGIPTDSIGIPLLWDGSRCLVGDYDIIEFFKTKANE